MENGDDYVGKSYRYTRRFFEHQKKTWQHYDHQAPKGDKDFRKYQRMAIVHPVSWITLPLAKCQLEELDTIENW